MNAMRSSPVRARPPRRRQPVWGIVGVVVLATVALLAVSLGLVWWFSSSGDDDVAATPTPLPCTTTLVVPAESLPAASSVVVNVFNSTDRPGLAAQTADELRAAKYTVKKVGNAPDERLVPGVAELRFGSKGEQAAKRLQFLIPGADLVPIERTNKRVDVVLGTAFAGLAPEAEAVAAMASPTPSLSGPGCPISAATPTPSAPLTAGPTGTPSP